MFVVSRIAGLTSSFDIVNAVTDEEIECDGIPQMDKRFQSRPVMTCVICYAAMPAAFATITDQKVLVMELGYGMALS